MSHYTDTFHERKRQRSKKKLTTLYVNVIIRLLIPIAYENVNR